MHGRLRWLMPEELSEAQLRFYGQVVSTTAQGTSRVDERGRLEGPFNALIMSPAIGEAVQHLSQVVQSASTLSVRTRELVILTVARHTRSDYQWYVHVVRGTAAGITAAEIDAVLHGRELPDVQRAEDLALRTATSFLLTGDLDDDLCAEAQEGLGDDVVMELLALVGHYQLIAMLLRVARTPLPNAADGVVSPLRGPSGKP